MKIILRAATQGVHGKRVVKKNTNVEGMLNRDAELPDLKRIWEAEKTINELTNIRLHIEILK